MVRIFVVYHKADKEVKEEIQDMYWFEENMVHFIEPQYIQGYGNVTFVVEVGDK